jgi:hypothetical protein
MMSSFAAMLASPPAPTPAVVATPVTDTSSSSSSSSDPPQSKKLKTGFYRDTKDKLNVPPRVPPPLSENMPVVLLKLRSRGASAFNNSIAVY